MKRYTQYRITCLLAALLLLVSGGVAQAQLTADYFHLVAERSIGAVVDIAMDDQALYLLAPNEIRKVNLGDPGASLVPTRLRATGMAFEQMIIAGDDLWLWSQAGRLGRAALAGPAAEVLQSWQLEDSVYAVIPVGGFVAVASGFNGVQLYLLAGDELKPMQSLTNGVHYSGLAASGQLLAAIDDYNGVELYHFADDSLELISEFLSLDPLLEVAIAEVPSGARLVATNGLNDLMVWDVSSSGVSITSKVIETDFVVTALTAAGSQILISGRGGELMILPEGGDAPVTVETPGVGARRMVSSGGTGEFSVGLLDPYANVTVCDVAGSQLSRARWIVTPQAPSSVALTGDGALVGTVSGIAQLYQTGSDLIQFPLWENGGGFDKLAELDSLLFGISKSQQRLEAFAARSGKLRRVASLELLQPPIDIIPLGQQSGRVALAVVLTGQVQVVEFDQLDGSFASIWNVNPQFKIAVAAVGESSLVILSQEGEVYRVSFSISSGPLGMPILGVLDRYPTAAAVADDFVAIGYADKLMIYRVDSEQQQFEYLLSPLAITNVIRLQFDPQSEVLVIGGRHGVQFADFSHPAELGVVYSVPGSDAVLDLAYRDGRLCVVSRAALQLFEASGVAPERRLPDEQIAAEEFAPNPFNNASEVTISLSQELIGKPITYEIVNILGERVVELRETVTRPQETFRWEGRSERGTTVASGVYFFRASVAGNVLVRKLVYLK